MERTPETNRRVLEESGEALYIVHHDDQSASGKSNTQQQDSGWDSLKDVPFRGEQQEEADEEEMSM